MSGGVSGIAAGPASRTKVHRTKTRGQVADPWGFVELVESHGVDFETACERFKIELPTGRARMRVAGKVPRAERFYDDPDIEYFHVSSCADMSSELRVMTLRVLSARAKLGKSARGDDAREVSKLAHRGARMTTDRINEVMDFRDDEWAEKLARWVEEDEELHG